MKNDDSETELKLSLKVSSEVYNGMIALIPLDLRNSILFTHSHA